MRLEASSKEELAVRLRSSLDRQEEQRIQLSDTGRLMEQLHVHQLELEAQNRELRDSRQALEHARQRYEDLYDFGPVAYFTLDTSGVVTEVNLAGAVMINQERARVVGRAFHHLVTLEDRSALERHLLCCIEQRRPVVGELVFSTKRGRVETHLVSAPVMDPAGAVASFRTALVDVSERNQALRERQRALCAEQSLRAQLDELDRANAALVESLSSTLSSTATVLPIIVQRARVLVGAEYAALGLTKGPGEPFDPFLYDGVDERLLERLGRSPRAVGVFGIVVREGRTVSSKDLRESPAHRDLLAGHPPMTSFLGLPIALRDHTMGSLYVANKRGGGEFTQDDQRTLERFAGRAAVACHIARLQQETREAVQLRDLALAVVSHDMRNPVGAILMNCTMLTRDAPQTERRSGRSRIEAVRRSAEHMNRLIEDLLTASTIESGTLSICPELTSMHEIVQEVAEMMQAQAAAKSLRLEPRVADALPAAWCDRARIIQVLGNLVGNALKFSPEAEVVRIDVRQERGEILVSVEDAGPGIPPDALEHVFDRYWKAEPRRGGGAGLGLFIARGIVAAHGGRIWARSDVGRGSTVSFTLPLGAPCSSKPGEGA